MSEQKRSILVTSALPYANGVTHLGHLLEHIQADIWVRFQKHRGHDCLFICGDDAHGTPIMLSAEKDGISPEQLIEQIHQDRRRDFDGFLVEFDEYYTTHSKENQQHAATVYNRLKAKGDIETRTIMQCYDTEKSLFLPDRYVKGTCPKCQTSDQYGDNCESCGATYTPSELIEPTSVLTGTTPTQKESLHYFFKLENYHDVISEWIQAGHLQKPVSKKLMEWFDVGLQSWDISRDEPYFGIEIPDAPGKYFYVWLDAPIGYMSIFDRFCQNNPSYHFDDYWAADSNKELYHFVGKDIIYFHALFWPAILQGSNHRKPSNVFTHGFLTVNGQKMSKSRGTFIAAQTYLNLLEPEYLRYYYAAKLNESIDDIDLNLEDFVQRVNADLIGKLINIASRCAGFITKKHDGMLAETLEDPALFNQCVEQNTSIAHHFESRNYHHAIREIMTLADHANQYIAEKEPWVLAKQEGKEVEVQQICTQGLNLFKMLIGYLKPVLPSLSVKVETFLNIEPLTWSTSLDPLLNHQIKQFKPLMQRLDMDVVEQLTTQKTDAHIS